MSLKLSIAPGHKKINFKLIVKEKTDMCDTFRFTI